VLGASRAGKMMIFYYLCSSGFFTVCGMAEGHITVYLAADIDTNIQCHAVELSVYCVSANQLAMFIVHVSEPACCC